MAMNTSLDSELIDVDDGSVSFVEQFPAANPWDPGITGMVARDLDGDGDQDLLLLASGRLT